MKQIHKQNTNQIFNHNTQNPNQNSNQNFNQKFLLLFRRILCQLYPDRCPVCDRVLYDTRICPECAKKLRCVAQPFCFSCGKPLADDRQEYCSDCMKKKHAFTQGKAVFVYQGAMREIMYRYKYSNRRDYTDFFASEAAVRYAGWIRQCGIQEIVPIPLSKKKKRQRGYNQAALFAKRLALLCGVPVNSRLLVRVRDTTPQKQLTVWERKKNLKNAFKIVQDVVKLKKVLLVDDIYTTGSTMDAAADALKQAGITDVYFVCISIGQGQ